PDVFHTAVLSDSVQGEAGDRKDLDGRVERMAQDLSNVRSLGEEVAAAFAGRQPRGQSTFAVVERDRRGDRDCRGRGEQDAEPNGNHPGLWSLVILSDSGPGTKDSK